VELELTFACEVCCDTTQRERQAHGCDCCSHDAEFALRSGYTCGNL
jgi:hypothetical protein